MTLLNAKIGAILFIMFLILSLFYKKYKYQTWLLSLVAGSCFFIFSVFTVINEGLLGFWTEHIRNLWGNQIWFDLLLAAASFWALILPRARKCEMRLSFWAILIVIPIPKNNC